MRTVITPLAQTPEEVAALVRYFHRIREDDRVSWARALHDEMGDLLLTAAMDIGWVGENEGDLLINNRLQRISSGISDLIDIERKLIERLRPTLLDTMGLFEALRWYFKHACQQDGAECHDALPTEEIQFGPVALSNIFRVAQSLLDCTFQEDALRTVDLEVTNRADFLSIRLAQSHVDREKTDVRQRYNFELESAAHRVAAVGGELSYEAIPRGLVFQFTVPLNATNVNLR
jgi:two-component system, NarL family, sensor histidine kinase UhpB